jgi:ribosomal protein S18 acetylase RimI-like enzyme
LTFRIADFDPVRHDRTRFCSGVTSIDNFLKFTAKKQQNADMVRVRVMTEGASNGVIGYYVLNAHSISAEELPDDIARKAPQHRLVPAAYISMIGVDLSRQGEGLGRILLANALRQILLASEYVATAVAVLDVLDDGNAEAVDKRKLYYKRFGFIELKGQGRRLFMPTALAQKVVERLG